MQPYKAFLAAFFAACEEGELSKVREAIASGRLTAEDLNEGLAIATTMAHPDVVAALFDAGATVSDSTVDALPGGGEVPQNPSLIRHFLNHGLDPNYILPHGWPLLSLLDNTACARELLLHGADPNLINPRGMTPLYCAIVDEEEEDTSRIELLLAHGAKLESDLLFAAVGPRVPKESS